MTSWSRHCFRRGSLLLFVNNKNKSGSTGSCCCCQQVNSLYIHRLRLFESITISRSRSRSRSTITITTKAARTMASIGCGGSSSLQGEELLPPALDSASDPPSLFDGTTRLYISYICPFAQRAWIARNCKGLQEKIKLVAIDLNNRPAWYKEKLYPANKVPALEHNNEVKGESLDLIKYLNIHFEGPALLPDDPAKREFAEELFSYTDTFSKDFTLAIKGNGEIGAPFDYLEKALSKFDGPFFLSEFSLVDIAYAPFTQRYHPLALEVKDYDITAGRPKLTSWIEELDKIEGYKQTKMDPQMLLGVLKKMLALN